MRISRSLCHVVTGVKFVIICISVASVVFILERVNWHRDFSRPIILDSMEQHLNIVNNYFEQRMEWTTSNLGTYLFKYGNNVRYRSKRYIFNVLIWKYWPWLELRHVYRFQNNENDKINPLRGCSVSNCRFSGDFQLDAADAVVVHLQTGLVPNITSRNLSQIWIFWVDESPLNAFTLSNKWPKLTEFANIFNWSMTYRPESDIPVPYGRTLPLKYPKIYNTTYDKLKDLVPYWKFKQTDVLASILISNCYAPRFNFVKKLNMHIKIDIFGSCALDKSNKHRCPGHFRSDCIVTSKYLFYLVAENSKCQEYISEKCFHHAYSKGAIPVIMGSQLEDCNKLLPPDSFLHVDNFETLAHLALEMIAISKNVTKLLSYHVWRNHFEIRNEHGYFGTKSSHLCRICEALNYNERTQKVYGLDDIRLYLDPDLCCSRILI